MMHTFTSLDLLSKVFNEYAGPAELAEFCNVCESPEAHGDTRGSRSERLSIGEDQ